MKETTRTVLISFGTSAASILSIFYMLHGRLESTEVKAEETIKHQIQTDIEVATLKANTLNMVMILNEVKNDVKEIRKDLQKRR